MSWILHGWVPQGDEGWIALKVHDVFTAHPPVQAMRSTSNQSWPGIWAHHPGPMQFYLMAVPYAVAAYHPAGLVIGGLLLATGLIALALWHGWQAGRRAGLTAVVVAIVVSELLLGPSLVLPWNPWPPVLGTVALLVLAWRLLLGHTKVLPWFAVVGSLVLQANLALVAMLFPLLLVLGGVGLLRWHQTRSTLWPLPGWRAQQQCRVWRRSGVVATMLTLVCWMPSITELFIISPNNASQLWAIATREMRDPLHILGAVLLVAACGWPARRIAIQPQPSRRDSARWISGPVGVGSIVSIVAGGAGRLVYLVMMVGGAGFSIAVWPRWGAVIRRAGIVLPSAWAVIGIAIALTVGPGGPGALVFTSFGLADVQRARPVTHQVVSALRARGVLSGPVIVRADGLHAAGSYETAVIVVLTVEGYTPYYDSWWPRPEHDDYRHERYAPANSAVVTVSDDKPSRSKSPATRR